MAEARGARNGAAAPVQRARSGEASNCTTRIETLRAQNCSTSAGSSSASTRRPSATRKAPPLGAASKQTKAAKGAVSAHVASLCSPMYVAASACALTASYTPSSLASSDRTPMLASGSVHGWSGSASQKRRKPGLVVLVQKPRK